MAEVVRIADVLAGKRTAGEPVTVQGWVRTRRNSKAGLSFLQLHDGSCFDTLQLVAPASLENYEDEVLRLTASCAVIASGTLAPSQGRGQAVELQVEAIEVVGWVDDPESYPIQPKRHTFEYLREVAHLRVAHQHPRCRRPGAALPGPGHPPLLPRTRASTGSTRPSSPPATARAPARCSASPRWIWPTCPVRPRAPSTSAQDFFGQARLPHRLRPAQRRDLLPRADARLHLRPHVPRRELQHQPPSLRVLDGRAGDRLRRPRCRRRPGRGVCSSTLFRTVLDERADDMAFFAERIDKEASRAWRPSSPPTSSA